MKKGAISSPRHKAFAAHPHVAVRDIPPMFGIIPSQLSYWGNNIDGDCVSAEEACAKAVYSLMNGGSHELFISEQEVIAWATKHNFLNGANLTEVMDVMATDGMIGSDNKTYTDGSYHSVDWTNDATLSSAIYQGPVKIGVAANQLDNAVTPGKNGWVALNFHADTAEDHCVLLCGYGTLKELTNLLGVHSYDNDPAGNDRAYLMFTWNSIGVIDRQSMINITSEAWLRVPTTLTGTPTPTPTPIPTPTPTPIPTPTPTPVPNDVLSWNKHTKTVSVPNGYKAFHQPRNPRLITIHLDGQVIAIPQEYTEV